MSTQVLGSKISIVTGNVTLAGCLGMLYALLAYAVGVSALFWVFLAVGGFAPYGFAGQSSSWMMAVLCNSGLVFGFAVQHSVMARRSFKQWWAQFIPAHLERATFVLMSGFAMGLLVYYWQAIPGEAWSMASTGARVYCYGFYAFGVLYVLACSFATNHFELFGLRQAYLNLMGRPYEALPFRQHWMYRYSRHPMMLGILIVLWASPDMSMARLYMALMLSVYIFVGIRFEERGLVQEFGNTYRKYREHIGMFFTLK